VEFEDLLVHTATVQRHGTREDRFGQPVLDDWNTLGQFTCRLTPPKGGERYTDRSQGVVVADYVLYFLPAATIGEADRVSVVTAADGSVLAQDLDVLLVQQHCDLEGAPHHLEVPCRLHREPSSG